MRSSPQDSALFTESSAPDGPAPISAWQVFASDWVAHVRASSERSFASSSAFGPGGSSWRTSPVSCRAPAPAPAAESAPGSSGRLSRPTTETGPSRPPASTFLAMQPTLFEEDPADADVSEMEDCADLPAPDDAWHCTAGGWVPSSGGWGNAGMASPTECWTLRTSESPSDAVVSSLSDILETRPVPPKYFLSLKAAAGILRRASRRGRELPAELLSALSRVAAEEATE